MLDNRQAFMNRVGKLVAQPHPTKLHMLDKKTEILLDEFLRNLGFNVLRIPRSDEERRPDFIASKDRETYVIEERSKEILRLFDEAERQAKKCGIGSASDHLMPSNTLSGIVKGKKGQLAHTESADAFQILWFSCMRSGAEHIFELMRRTLYGLAYVSVWSATAPDLLKPSLPCYYYSRNTFFSCPWLDATVLWSEKQWALCVNDFSDHVEALRKSSLYRLFVEGGGLVDAPKLEKAGHAFLIRGSVDRTDEQAKWGYLLKEYGVRTSVLLHTNEQEKPGERSGRKSRLKQADSENRVS